MAQNSGYDPQETLLKLQTEQEQTGQLVGADLSTGQNHSNAVVKDSIYRASFNVLNGIINCFTGEPMVAADAGVWDNYSVKKQLLFSWYDCALLNWQNI